MPGTSTRTATCTSTIASRKPVGERRAGQSTETAEGANTAGRRGVRDLTPRAHPSAVATIGQYGELADTVEQFLLRYANPTTRQETDYRLQQMVRHCGRHSLGEITENDVQTWITSPGANNTVRQRLSTARTFFGWCSRKGLLSEDPTADLQRLTKQFPKTYGKAQAPNPARWLTRNEASSLIGDCQDGTPMGLRDEIVLRLALAGMRSAEIRSLTISNLILTQTPPEIRWIGKGRRSRQIVPGQQLVDAIHRHLSTWTDETGNQPLPTDHLIPPRRPGGTTKTRRPTRLAWGAPICKTLVYDLITKHAHQAGLGHVAPHDLRRSAAGILHHTKTDDGGHVFDLLDIQKVLGHADPATTQRSYLDPLDTDVISRAGDVLDC